VKIWLYLSGPSSVFPGRSELRPHERRFDAAGDEHEERRDDVAPADRLVIDGRQPAPQPGFVANAPEL
jgi:hypothetical protein